MVQGQACPLPPLSQRARDRHGQRRHCDDACAQSDVDAQPGVGGQAVGSRAGAVLLRRGPGFQRLFVGSDGTDEVGGAEFAEVLARRGQEWVVESPAPMAGSNTRLDEADGAPVGPPGPMAATSPPELTTSGPSAAGLTLPSRPRPSRSRLRGRGPADEPPGGRAPAQGQQAAMTTPDPDAGQDHPPFSQEELSNALIALAARLDNSEDHFGNALEKVGAAVLQLREQLTELLAQEAEKDVVPRPWSARATSTEWVQLIHWVDWMQASYGTLNGFRHLPVLAGPHRRRGGIGRAVPVLETRPDRRHSRRQAWVQRSGRLARPVVVAATGAAVRAAVRDPELQGRS